MKKLFAIGISLFALPIFALGGEEIVSLAKEKGSRLGVDPYYVLAVANVESKEIPDARSSKGALGLMQVMPQTAEFMGISRTDLTNPERNMEAGVRYLSRLNRLFDGNPYLMAAAYNAGEGAVKKHGGIPPYRETKNYVPAVMVRYLMLRSCGLDCYSKEYMDNPRLFWQRSKLLSSKKQVSVSNSNALLAWAGIREMEMQPQLEKVQVKVKGIQSQKFKSDVNGKKAEPVMEGVEKVREDGFVTMLAEDGETFVSVGEDVIR